MPVGVIGAVFEARPNVTIDVASQVLKARSAAVLRTGAAALGSATALVELVIAPSLQENGVPAEAVQLVPTPGHAGADALVGLPDLVPLVVVRGSGDVTRRLSALGAAAGTRVLAHADGGGVLYLDASADEAAVARMVHDSTTGWRAQPAQPADRPSRDTGPPQGAWGARPAELPPHSHRLGHEWALTPQRGRIDRRGVDGPVDANLTAARDLRLARRCAQGEGGDGVHRRLHGYRRVLERADPLLDGHAAGPAETGINADHTPPCGR